MIHLTPEAAKHIRGQLLDHKAMIGIRVSLVKSGCSGFKHKISFVRDFDATWDLELKISGIRVFILRDDIEKLEGIDIDYIRNQFGSGFKFHSHNIISQCGCGESFSY